MSLQEYRKKRDFSKTSEPKSKPVSKNTNKSERIFVVQEHWASHLHYDFRLEAFGTLKSWAVPKGPSTEVGDKRLAVEVEDHPLDYANFHGTIPKGEYGAGKVKIWDKGTWVPPKDLKKNLNKGHLEFELNGKKLKGKWMLVRTKQKSGKKNQWLLIKRNDEPANKTIQKPTPKKRADRFPVTIEPQLALLSSQVPSGTKWIHENKFDGYRTIVKIKNDKVQFFTRNGHNWTEKYSPLAKEFEKLKLKSAVIDGEIVVLNEKGQSDFSELQEALSEDDFSEVFFYAFDLLYIEGRDTSKLPLEERKQLLKKIIKNLKKIKYSNHWLGRGDELFENSCREGLEGIVSKDRTAPYTAGRSSSWQKIKCSNRQEFVIGGFTEGKDTGVGIGALLVGAYEGKELIYVGKVGTGFKNRDLNELYKTLTPSKTKNSPFANLKKSAQATWVKPEHVCEVEFRDWTRDNILRHAAFKGLRKDKPAKDIVTEEPAKTVSKKTKKNSGGNQEFRISNPDRIVFPAHKRTKLDVAQFYKSIAPWLLPHIIGRPLALVRCPDNINKQCFFQKHIDNSKATEVSETLIDGQKVIYIDSESGLLQLVQWGVIEIHPWQTHVDSKTKGGKFPDQIIFDLDPAPNVKWPAIVSAAIDFKELLEKLKLKSFVKTTGGKGLHVHVPIVAKYSWDQVKAFSKTVCKQLESEAPQKFTTNMSKKKRAGKIFLDYLRNGFGATAIAPYALRTKKDATVAVPIEWNELKKIKGGDEYDIESSLARLIETKKDPWKNYYRLKQKILLLEK